MIQTETIHKASFTKLAVHIHRQLIKQELTAENICFEMSQKPTSHSDKRERMQTLTRTDANGACLTCI